MTNPSQKKIIRGAEVEGVVFFGGKDEPPMEKQQSSTQQKMLSSGKSKDLAEALKEAEKSGYRKGLEEGHLRGFETGKGEGLEVGYKLGTENAYLEIKSNLELLKAISKTFFDKQNLMFEEAKPELIRFCIAICESILRQTLSNPITFASHIERLLNEAKDIIKDTTADIILAPEDFNKLQTTIEMMNGNSADFKKLNFIPDSSFERGNCRIETPLGLLNFDIKRLLDEIEKMTIEVNPTPLPKE